MAHIYTDVVVLSFRRAFSPGSQSRYEDTDYALDTLLTVFRVDGCSKGTRASVREWTRQTTLQTWIRIPADDHAPNQWATPKPSSLLVASSL